MTDVSHKDSCRAHIKVVFAPGCYGHYLAQCIYTYSDLNRDGHVLSLSSSGDSHQSRHTHWFGDSVYCEHLDVYQEGTSNHVVVIVPDSHHALDYFVANYVKAYRSNWEAWMQRHFGACQNLLQNWGSYGSWHQVPHWVQREFMSLNIHAWLSAGYNPDGYLRLRSTHTLKTNILFDIMSSWFGEMLLKLGLTKTQLDTVIDQSHWQFVQQQSCHNLQNHCIQWCKQVLCSAESRIEILNVVQEAYIQAWFRSAGYEIKCHDLDTLPTCSLEMKKLLYETSQDYR